MAQSIGTDTAGVPRARRSRREDTAVLPAAGPWALGARSTGTQGEATARTSLSRGSVQEDPQAAPRKGRGA